MLRVSVGENLITITTIRKAISRAIVFLVLPIHVAIGVALKASLDGHYILLGLIGIVAFFIVFFFSFLLTWILPNLYASDKWTYASYGGGNRGIISIVILFPALEWYFSGVDQKLLIDNLGFIDFVYFATYFAFFNFTYRNYVKPNTKVENELKQEGKWIVFQGFIIALGAVGVAFRPIFSELLISNLELTRSTLGYLLAFLAFLYMGLWKFEVKNSRIFIIFAKLMMYRSILIPSIFLLVSLFKPLNIPVDDVNIIISTVIFLLLPMSSLAPSFLDALGYKGEELKVQNADANTANWAFILTLLVAAVMAYGAKWL